MTPPGQRHGPPGAPTDADALDVYLRYLDAYFGASRVLRAREGHGAHLGGGALTAAAELGRSDARARRIARSAEELLEALGRAGGSGSEP